MANSKKKHKPSYDIGEKIGGRYLIHDALMGNMGEVFLCLDIERNYPFALKTFQKKYLDNPGLKESFLREVAIWIALEKHPNIVRCFYMDTIDDRPFMFLEWVASDIGRGTDLRSWIENKPIELQAALQVAIDICHGLIQANKKEPGIVHRDLKPGNILIAQGMVAKITDFGLASVVKGSKLPIDIDEFSPLGDQSIVREGEMVGTPAYMSPEQWRAEELDVRADIYAMGCVLYEMLTGRMPYFGDTLEGFFIGHVTQPPPTLPPELNYPSAINSVILRCMAKNKDDRFSSFSDLKYALVDLYMGLFNSDPRLLDDTVEFSAFDYNYRGFTYDRMDMYEEALADYTRAINLDSTFVMAYNNRGAAYERLREYEKALADYTMAIEADPTMALAYYNRGNVYSKMKRQLAAIEDYTSALQIDPRLTRAYVNRGSEYYALGKPQEARADFSSAIFTEPTYAKAYINRGVIYDRLKMYDKALEDYTRAIELTPNDPDVYFNRGLTYYNTQRYQEALADFTKVIELNPEDMAAYYYHGLCEAQIKPPPEKKGSAISRAINALKQREEKKDK